MQETNKANNDKNKSGVKYMRTAIIERAYVHGELPASQQMDEIKAFAQAQGVQVNSGVPRIEESVQKGKQ